MPCYVEETFLFRSFFVVLFGLIGLLTACELTADYQLDFYIVSADNGLVTCHLENIGREELEDAQVQVEYIPSSIRLWTSGVDLGTGESRTVSVYFPGVTSSTESDFVIRAAGWNIDD